jgi:hydrogenase maturation protein HypF
VSASAADAPQRLRIRVRGAVQGVGFRPFVFALARRFELSGFVLNDDEGVLAEIEGRGLDRFLEALTAEPPRLARVTGVEVTPVSPEASRAFTIEMSRPTARRGRTGIVPDTVTCRTCRGELFDPASRFYLYPFVTCTQCGPRLSILKSLP